MCYIYTYNICVSTPFYNGSEIFSVSASRFSAQSRKKAYVPGSEMRLTPTKISEISYQVG